MPSDQESKFPHKIKQLSTIKDGPLMVFYDPHPQNKHGKCVQKVAVN